MERCPKCQEILVNSNKCDCGWKKTTSKQSGNPYKFGLKIGDHWIDKQCGYNEHGTRCDLYGHMSTGTSGEGPWYCGKHFNKIMGFDERPSEPTRVDGFISTPVVDDMRATMKFHLEKQKRLQDALDARHQEEPGANG